MTRLKSFPTQDIILNTKMYNEYINELKMPNGWLPGNQEYNFKALLRLADISGVPLKGKGVLDVGCGTGDFVPLLRQQGINNYVGIDIYKPSLEKARKHYPNEMFIEGDLLTI